MEKISSARLRLMSGVITCGAMGLSALTALSQQGPADGWFWYILITVIALIGVGYASLLGTEINLSIGVKGGLPLIVLSVEEYMEAPPGWSPPEGQEGDTHSHVRPVWELRTPSSWE